MGMEKKIAIITGASSGLGEEYIRQLQNGKEELHEIWAIARRKDRLEEIAARVERPEATDGLMGVTVRAVPLDLTMQESVEKLEQMLKEEQPEVTLVINAAGFGKIGSYAEIPRTEIDRMIDRIERAVWDLKNRYGR